MIYFNNFIGKKEIVKDLAKIYKDIMYSEIADIELKKYRHIEKGYEEEFILLSWTNGAFSTANNNANSLTATCRNVARMLDGGVYENMDYYSEIMLLAENKEKWEEL